MSTIADGRIALTTLGVPKFFSMAVPDRAAGMVMVKLGETNWTSLLHEAPATKTALKVVPSLVHFTDKFKGIPTEGLEHWLRVQPAPRSRP